MNVLLPKYHYIGFLLATKCSKVQQYDEKYLIYQGISLFPSSGTLSPYYIHEIDKGYLICAQTHQSFEVYLNMYKKSSKYIEKLNSFSIV